MKMIDAQYLKTPFYGHRRMREMLKQQGENPGKKRVLTLMKTMGLEVIYPRPKTTIGNKEHYKYPYLLKGLNIIRPNQVWGTDITYIPIETGYLYMVAFIDLYSRYVVSWLLSDSLESEFCINAFENALKVACPEIINSDQGTQYTCKGYIEVLKKKSISISMSGRGRCWDNIFVERLWRTLKYEEVYPKSYISGKDAQSSLESYLIFITTKDYMRN